jgi:glycine oxidase
LTKKNKLARNSDQFLNSKKMIKVAIVGCGVIGAAIAYELSRIEGLDLTLIEQYSPGAGSTSAALGIMMGIISHKVKGRAWELRRKSLERYESLIPELEALTNLQIPYNRQGIVKITDCPQELGKWQEIAQIRKEQGFNLEIWDTNTLKSHCPQIDVEGNQLIAACYSPQDRQVNPSSLTKALVQGAVKNGVKCLFEVKVEDLITTTPGYCNQIKTSQGTLNVDWVIITSGIGSTPLVKSLDIRPVLGQAIELKLAKNLGKPEFQPIITGDDVHIAPMGGGEYWLGATVEFDSNQPDRSALETVKAKAFAFCPELATGEIVRTWSGLRPRPEGKPAPVIENLSGYNNVLVATGHYRNGILLAPATAIAIREKLFRS